MTFGKALDHYEAYLKYEKQNRQRSIDNTMARLRNWLPVDEPLLAMPASRAEKRYRERAEKVAGDTHRGELAELKTFGRWLCHPKRAWLSVSPFEEVEPVRGGLTVTHPAAV
jgi:hypothetical protein